MKIMARKTNSKEVKQAVKNYILESLEILDDYTTEAERLNAFIRQCEEVGKNGIYPNGNYRMLPYYEAVKETINGCFAAFEVGTWAICEIVAEWTDTNPDDFKTEKTEALYFNLIARETEALAKKYDVQLYRNYIKAR